MTALLKYGEVARTTIRSQWAYIWNQLLSNLFLVVILFVFAQLWKVTYAAQGTDLIDGYRLPEMLWYLVATEALITSLPRIQTVLEQEVRNGDLAIRLNKPYSYLAFHYAAFFGEGLLRFLTSLLVGGSTIYLLVGGFPYRWEATPLLLLLFITTQALNFCFSAAIGLAAFWVEDVTGLYLLLDRVKWMLGGMLLPLEVYPEAIRRVAEALPFRHMVGGPARLFVKFAWPEAGQLLLAQSLWLALFALACGLIYHLGVRRVDLNGG